jgi:hypothetical protein
MFTHGIRKEVRNDMFHLNYSSIKMGEKTRNATQNTKKVAMKVENIFSAYPSCNAMKNFDREKGLEEILEHDPMFFTTLSQAVPAAQSVSSDFYLGITITVNSPEQVFVQYRLIRNCNQDTFKLRFHRYEHDVDTLHSGVYSF